MDEMQYIERNAILNLIPHIDGETTMECVKRAIEQVPAANVIDLTLSQIENLMEFIEVEFIPSIRDNEDIDSMNYIVDMSDIYKKLLEAKEKAMEERK